MTAKPPISRKLTTGPTLGDQAYQAIRAAITSGDLAAGERTTERALARRLGVSPTPVREALQRLEHERLISRPSTHVTCRTANRNGTSTSAASGKT